MIYEKIDFEKSINKGKVIFKEHIFYKVFDFFITLFFIAIVVFSSIMNIIKNGYSIFSISLFILSIILFFLTLYSLLNNSKLKAFNGIYENNRKLVFDIFSDGEWTVIKNNSKYVILSKGYNWYSWDFGKQITIFFLDDKILINCTSFGRGNTKSPFHWFANRRIENKLITKLEFKLNK